MWNRAAIALRWWQRERLWFLCRDRPLAAPEGPQQVLAKLWTRARTAAVITE